MAGPLITFTTDFGDRDPSAAICRGVALSICPDARILDVSHQVEKYAVRDAALLLWSVVPWLPVGVHVAVVDPGVGSARAPIGIRVARGDHLVGPDNGLLLPAAERLGGPVAVHRLDAPAYRLAAVSRTFHGRDIFTPAAAHLAAGAPLSAFGPALDPATLVRLAWPAPVVRPGLLEAEIISVDGFGNVKLGAEPADLRAALGDLAPGAHLVVELRKAGVRPRAGTTQLGAAPAQGPVPATVSAPDAVLVAWAGTFGDVERGEALLYEDAYGRLGLALREASFAARHGVASGVGIRVTRA